MSNDKKRDWKRILTLSVVPRPDVTTLKPRTFLIDVCVGADGKGFFLLNSEFAEMEPRDIARIVKAIASKKTYNNVFVHEEHTFAAYKKEDVPKPAKEKKKTDDDIDFDFEDDASDEGDDFDA